MLDLSVLATPAGAAAPLAERISRSGAAETMMLRAVALAALVAASAADVTVTPFCKNSVRVQVTASGADADVDYINQAAALA